MAKKVFLSYSWRDQHIAYRLYRDLKASNVPIWRDQSDGDPLADFKEEFLHQIDECDYFILCDSINYRKKSTFCIDEVERCLQNQKNRQNGPEIIVCLLDKLGDWRNLDFQDKRKRDVFRQINDLKYPYELYYSGYDNENAYNKALNGICDTLGVKYEKWNKVPTAKDLEDEIKKAITSPNYDDSDIRKKVNEQIEKVIKAGYELIVHKQEMNYPNIKDSYKVWIEDCQHCELNLFFPHWTYATWYLNQPESNLYDALNLFKNIAFQYPNDFRGHRGMGHIAAMIGQEQMKDGNRDSAFGYYKVAEDELKESIRLMDEWQREHCEFGDLCTLGTVCYETSRFEEAQTYWESALNIKEQQGHGDLAEEVVASLFVLKMKQGVPLNNIKNWLLALQEKHPTDPILYQKIGLVCGQEERPDFYGSLKMMQTAYALDRSWESLGYLLAIKKKLGLLGRQDIVDVKEKVLTIHTGTSDYTDLSGDKEWLSTILELFQE